MRTVMVAEMSKFAGMGDSGSVLEDRWEELDILGTLYVQELRRIKVVESEIDACLTMRTTPGCFRSASEYSSYLVRLDESESRMSRAIERTGEISVTMGDIITSISDMQWLPGTYIMTDSEVVINSDRNLIVRERTVV